MVLKRCRSSRSPAGVLIVMTLCLAALPSAPVLGQCDPVETGKIVAFDGVTGDLFFGDSVAVDGNVAVIGAAQDDTLGADAGAAYVYHYDGANWAYETKLTAVDGVADDLFGISVAISGDVMIVGAQNHDEGG
ncbi:MAG: FG-GAP repeat protein, partial [Acidobacteriota bacterium]